MDTKELRLQSPDALKTLLHEQVLKKEELSLQIREKKVTNVKQIREVRKTIARILTVLRLP